MSRRIIVSACEKEGLAIDRTVRRSIVLRRSERDIVSMKIKQGCCTKRLSE
jgi:hypothetical protein